MLKKINYGWIIVTVCSFVIAMNAIALFGFGVFLKPLTEEFGWDRGDLSSVFSIAVLIGGILSLVSGRLSNRFSPRLLMTIAGLSLGTGFMLTSRITELWQLYFAFGIPVGITISCSVIPVNATIPRWFTRGRGIAMAIPAVGFSVGGVIGPLLVETLIASYGWQQAFLILGILPFAITVPLAQFMKQAPEDEGSEENAGTAGKDSTPVTDKFPVRQILGNRWFWAYGCMQFTFGFSTQMIIVHIAPYGTDVGLSPIIAAGILSFSSAIGIFGNLTAGALADRMNPRIILTASFVTLTVSLVLLLFARNAPMFYIFAFIFGFGRGAVAIIQTLSAVNLFGVKYFGFYMGAFLLCGTTGGVVGTPVAGYIFDASGSYGAAFWMAIAAGGIAVLVSILLLRHKTQKYDNI